MPGKKRLLHCGCICLALASFALIGAIVAQPILSTLWPPRSPPLDSPNPRNLSEQGISRSPPPLT
jgi:hypothetical protein